MKRSSITRPSLPCLALACLMSFAACDDDGDGAGYADAALPDGSATSSDSASGSGGRGSGDGGRGGALGSRDAASSGDAATGGDAGDAGKFITRVPSGKRTNELTEADVQQLCMDAKDWTIRAQRSIIPKQCRLLAVLQSFPSVSECEKDIIDCIAKPAPTNSDLMCRVPSCTATVGELQDCINDQWAGTHTLLDMVPTCAEAAKGAQPPTEQEAQELTQPPSCKALEAKCAQMEDVGDMDDVMP